MIAGIFHQGSGLGNQLFRYVTTRTLAEDKGYEWGMIYRADGSGKEAGFKGKFFLEQPKFVNSESDGFSLWEEKKVVENGVDIRGYDPEINFVKDNTIIDGEFQDIRYWGHKLPEIDQWLKVEPIEIRDNLCVIGFRGGEYSLYPELFLSELYWFMAIEEMRRIDKNINFEVHTDDPVLAQQLFPHFKVIHDIGINWRSIRYAKYAIIANSSFYIMPRLLNGGYTIAPKGWARHNWHDGGWYLPQNYYSEFTYI